MAFPVSILLNNNTVMTITGALSRTLTPRWVFGNMRRDLFSAAKLGNSYQPVVLETAAQTAAVPTLSAPFTMGSASIFGSNAPYSIVNTLAPNETAPYIADGPAHPPITALNGAIVKDATGDVKCAMFEEDDDYTHTASRPDPELKTFVEYWDHATNVGIAQTLYGTPAVGSASVTFPGSSTLTIGQKLTANTSFPSGAFIVALYYKPELADVTTESERGGTIVMLSHLGDAAAVPEEFVFTGANLIAWHTPEGDIAAGGSFALLS